jgi:predicted TIM-barrel fold metal-dependent hydrolase
LFKNLIDWKKQHYGATIKVRGVSTIAYGALNDIDAQVQVTDEAGITLSLLSFSMQHELICSKLPLAPEQLAAKKLNDRTAELVARYPGKLAFMANVNPMNKSSVAECERCINRLRAKGVNVSTSWKGKFLDSDKLDHFWEYADDQRIPVYLHPPLLPIGYRSMNKYRLEETVGRPFDTAMTVARMIYSGVFDRFPRLRVVLPHMGGGLPGILGRLDFGYRLGYEGLPDGEAAVCRRKPSEYLKRNLYADVMGFSPAGVRHCLEIFGPDRLLFGSDYPAVDISPIEHVRMVEGLGLNPEDLEKILWKNANDLFRLELDAPIRDREDRKAPDSTLVSAYC